MAEPITLEFLKAHARITTDLEDELLAAYLTAAREKAETYCNTQFTRQVVSKTFTINQVCDVPTADILDVRGFFSTVADLPTGYTWFVEYIKGITISRDYAIDFDKLPTYTVSFQVTVEPEDVPAAVKVAIARIAADLYTNREYSGSQELGITAKTLLAAYRKF